VAIRYLCAYSNTQGSKTPIEAIPYEAEYDDPSQITNYLEYKYKDRMGLEVLDQEDPPLCSTSGEAKVKYLSVYTITRHYGGPEEGGWWYNTSHLRDTIPFEYSEGAESKLREYLKNKWKDEHGGDIYSVLGGSEMEILVEDTPGQHQDTEVPHYE